MPDSGEAPQHLGVLEWATGFRAHSVAVLDEIGRAALVLLPLLFLVALVVVLGLYYLLHLRGKSAVDIGELSRLAIGVAGLFGGASVFFTFAFTWPPAVEHLDVMTVKSIGLLGGMPMFILAWREVFPRLFPTEAAMPAGLASASVSSNRIDPSIDPSP